MNEYVKLLQYALRTISKKRYTVSEMRKKLLAFAEKFNGRMHANHYSSFESKTPICTLVEADVQRVIDRLSELNYLNDENFAMDYISDRIKFKPKGKIVLMQELTSKGLAKDVIEHSINKSNIDEGGVAITLLENRKPRWNNDALPKQKDKAYKFLYSRGFDKDSIYKALEWCYSSDS